MPLSYLTIYFLFGFVIAWVKIVNFAPKCSHVSLNIQFDRNNCSFYIIFVHHDIVVVMMLLIFHIFVLNVYNMQTQIEKVLGDLLNYQCINRSHWVSIELNPLEPRVDKGKTKLDVYSILLMVNSLILCVFDQNRKELIKQMLFTGS